MVDIEVAELGQIGSSLLVLSDLRQPARRLDGEEASHKDDGGKVYMGGIRNNPLKFCVARDVEV